MSFIVNRLPTQPVTTFFNYFLLLTGLYCRRDVSQTPTIFCSYTACRKESEDSTIIVDCTLSMADLNGQASIAYNESVVDHAKLYVMIKLADNATYLLQSACF